MKKSKKTAIILTVIGIAFIFSAVLLFAFLRLHLEDTASSE